MNKHRIHLFVLFSIIAYCNNVNAHIIDTGVDESGNESFYVSLTPNPAKSLVYVNYILPEGMPEAVLEITSVLGVKVIAVTLEGQCGSKEIDLGRLSPGVYNYTAYCGNNVFSGKLMITH